MSTLPIRQTSPQLVKGEEFSSDGRQSPTSATIEFLENHPDTLTTSNIGQILKRHKEAVLANVQERHQEELHNAYQRGKQEGAEIITSLREEAENNYAAGLKEGTSQCEKTHKDLQRSARQKGKEAGKQECEETHNDLRARARSQGVQEGVEECQRSHFSLQPARKKPTLTRTAITHTYFAPSTTSTGTETTETVQERIATVAGYSFQALAATLVAGALIGSAVIALVF